MQANSSVFENEQYVSVLDSLTSAICRSLDGKIFPIGQGAMPPVHWNCRSVRVAYFDDQNLAERPAKASTERRMVREYAEKNKITPIPKTRDALPYGTKGSYDTYARGRVRELTGQVPASVNYQEWLGRQSVEFQEDVLGKTKAKLYRDGNLKLDKFVNRAGDELTLSELAQREAQAFRSAGLNPDEFI